MNKKKLWIGAAIVLVLLAGWGVWSKWFSSTKVAFINYQVIALGEMSKANDNSFIKLSELSTDDLDKIGSYDMVFINAMGLRITQEQRDLIQKAADNGTPILSTAVTNPANNIVSVDSIQADSLKAYLGNGGRRNYRSLLNYVRKDIDGKIFSVKEPDPLVESANDLFYHADVEKPDEENLGFNTVAEYNAYLKKHNLFKEDAPAIIITGQMGEPKDLIKKLEETGNRVYPVRNINYLISHNMMDSINPAAVINMAHGRMGDGMVRFLTQQNIPLFAPLNVNRLVEEWEADKMGMSGGFLSQSVVTPEIDGAIRPFALFGHYKDEEGLQHAFAIPERLETFVQTVNNYISLQHKPNSEKRVAIYYYKGPGQGAMTAGGMEVVQSMYNLLKRMKQEGYTVNLPASPQELNKLIQSQGAVFGTYAEGAFDDFMKNGHPELISKEQYEGWVKKALRPEKYAEVVSLFGEFPGEYMSTPDGKLGVARVQLGNVVLLPQNMAGRGSNAFKVVHGTDSAPSHTYIASYLWTQYGFKADALIHFGTHGSLEFTPRKQVALCSNDWPDRLVGALPHFYIYSIGNVGEGMIAKRRSYAGLQSYLTPPFLESSLRGTYKELMDKIKIYNDKVAAYSKNAEGKPDNSERVQSDLRRASLAVKALTVKMGIHRELELDSILTKPYSEDDITRIENFAEEIATEKITGQLYTMGVPYESARINSSVYAMATEPIAYSVLALDKLRGKADGQVLKHKALFTQRYLNPARDLVTRLLANPALGTDELICRTAGITKEELEKAREIDRQRNAPSGMMAMMMAASQGGPGMPQEAADKAMSAMKKGQPADGKNKAEGEGKHHHGKMPAAMMEKMKEMTKDMKPEEAEAMAKKMGMNPEAAKKMLAALQGKDSKEKAASAPAHGDADKAKPAGMSQKKGMGGMGGMMARMMAKKEYTKEEVNFAMAVMEVERTIKNVGNYRSELLESPQMELTSMINAMNGGYTQPSPGGDPIANPNTLPTGRNMYGINAEATPSESAWEKGKQLAENTIEMYRRRHNDSIPRKVSYTLWSGEFIETEGATIAQILYMLGVEPVRDTFGRVTDLKLIPSKELGRPRIDVVVQTSGQLRDIAASRLFLINRAVEMAAAAKDDQYTNQVAEGVHEAERTLIAKGLTPKDAREISTFRVFGAANGGYGTGIQGMVMSSDKWDNEKEIADTYINNMGAYYGSEKNWEVFKQYAFEAALTRTDAVIQPRQSNTWGALSLDHVYEFMGGMNLAVRNVTGKDPDAYLSDYRNRNNVRMQEVKEAIGVESRSTIFNPTYIKEKMKGDAGSASTFTEIVQNVYGWNVMKPKAIDKELWDKIYNVYVKDEYNLGMQKYFEDKNPAALEEVTAVMMESARKGYWKASAQQLADVAALHTGLVKKFGPSGSSFSGNNEKLQQFIASKVNAQAAADYKQEMKQMKESAASGEQSTKNGMVLKKQSSQNMPGAKEEKTVLNGGLIVGIVLVVFVVLLVVVKKRRKK